MRRFRVILMSFMCVMILFTVTGCGNKTPITTDDFKTKMEENSYSVEDATSQMSNYDYVEKVYLAMDKDSKYQIEFYDLSDKDNASQFYNNNKSIFEESKSSGATETSVSIGNHAKYTLETNGKYKVISRIDDTVVYVDVDSTYKSEIKDLLEKLGY